MRKMSKLLIPTVVVGTIFGATSFSAMAATETVESGETLWGIAQEHDDVTVDELVDLNSNLDPTAIPVGTEIQLDANENNGSSGNNGMVTHTVQPGNTLLGIAAVYDGVTLEDLYELNPGIDPYGLTIRSEVTVVGNTGDSGSDADVVYHTVQPGNTFNEIASVYDGVTVDELIEANPNVDIYSLNIGSQVAIPLN
ncbi:LysM peptidoglycan-binding domain-containing protein [Aquibacillus halophilus]|uniref:LysM peptidoglycan-binding domain-containing protein n=1 Tax=Aquibacillus halophilus TaxID=930132 RepID=A0A6A8D7R7_9BACI|nr:LysM domain-containing protein [Aquibacillus halophilus]MRH41310.1 LysM peptidoglycan-binding domain-containing protein [Aquibacillus halophilus]